MTAEELLNELQYEVHKAEGRVLGYESAGDYDYLTLRSLQDEARILRKVYERLYLKVYPK